MLKVCCVVALALIMASGSVHAQPPSGSGNTAQPRRSYGPPIDHGPFTPEANAAFMGGGMILQGAPGAPPPRPEPTPPGQTPRNMVPP
jgi:hypothetical protein